MEWMSDGRRRRADFSVALPAAEAARRLRTALDPEGDWIEHVLRDAQRRARRPARRRPPGRRRPRRGDRQGARRPARRPAGAASTGERPEIVTSDARGRLAAHPALRDRAPASWLVSVLMVSEGVDIPRLRVGVYATSARTELFFRQVVGRFIRRTPAPKRADEPPVPAVGPGAQAARGPDRGGAQPRARAARRGRGGRARRARPSPTRRSARCGRAPAATTTCCRPPSPATRCSCSPRPRPSPRRRPRSPRSRRPSRSRRPRTSGASACATSAARWSPRVARRTGEAHRAINARVNREVGAASVAACTVDQLERANALLERPGFTRRDPRLAARHGGDPGHARPARDPGVDRAPRRAGRGAARARPEPRLARAPARGPARGAGRDRRGRGGDAARPRDRGRRGGRHRRGADRRRRGRRPLAADVRHPRRRPLGVDRRGGPHARRRGPRAR